MSVLFIKSALNDLHLDIFLQKSRPRKKIPLYNEMENIYTKEINRFLTSPSALLARYTQSLSCATFVTDIKEFHNRNFIFFSCFRHVRPKI